MTLDDAVGYATRRRGERKRPSTGWASLTPAELKVAGLICRGTQQSEDRRAIFHLMAHRRVTSQEHLRQIGDVVTNAARRRSEPKRSRENFGLALRNGQRFAGRDRAYEVPISTHLASWRFPRKSS
jgi:DNA-binding CsgD family transcriptional regulator